MGVKLMTGATGEQNIQAADDRECLAGITGLDSYVFPTGSQLKATLVDANTVTIGTGAGSLQGSRFRCSTTTTVTIQSGTQGQFRHDIVGLHFSRETSGREGLEFQVLTGEPAASEGAAADPAYTAGDLLKGDAEAFMPLYRVKLSGINASDPEPMFSVLTPLSTLRDSVSPRVLWEGSKASGNFTLSDDLSNWSLVGVYVSVDSTNNDRKTLMVPCSIPDLNSSGYGLNGSSSSMTDTDIRDVRVSLKYVNDRTLTYRNVIKTSLYTANATVQSTVAGRNVNGIVGLIRR